jgi:hypothetical protein
MKLVRMAMAIVMSGVALQAAAQGSSPSSPSPSPADFATISAADAKRHQDAVAAIAQVFASEKVNSAWAARTSARVNAAVEGNELLKAVQHSVDCRGQTCQLQLDDDGSGKLAGSLPLIILSVADLFPSIIADHVDQGNGHSTTILYMSSQQPKNVVKR